MRKLTIVAVVLGLGFLAGCSGVRQGSGAFVAHAESVRVFGFPIPEDDQTAAMKQVPSGAKITNVSSTPSDWTSVLGVLGNIFGIHQTSIGGMVD